MVDKETLTKFEDKLINVLDKACKIYGKQFDIPQLVFRKMGRKAGLAYYKENRIEMNSDFCSNGHLVDMINQTLVHEVAHLVSYRVYGNNGTGHKRCWKSVMYNLGGEVRRCHNYSLEGVTVQRRKTLQFTYTCGCQKTMLISKTIHNRIWKKGRVYRCRKCRQSIVWKKD